MKSSPRYIISLVMTAVYLLVIFAPLAPAALQSKFVLHAVTGECAGDCSICGCAAERSAANSCCCAQKKLADSKRVKAAGAASCCDSRSKARQPKITASCCSGRQSEKEHDEHGEHCQTAGHENGETIIAAIPCQSGKNAALAGSENIQHMPFKYESRIPLQLASSYHTPFIKGLINHPGEPPDPPPRISATS